MSMSDPRGIGVLERLKPLKARLEREEQVTAEFLFVETGSGSKTNVYQDHGAVLQQGYRRLAGGYNVDRYAVTAVRSEFSHPA